jgi:tripartite-type tricarboxylate transporter receptor subunit TctC
MLPRRSLLAATLAAPWAAPLAAPALAQEDFPNRPIRMIAPYAPGGQSDTVARLVAPKMSEFLGQSIVIENRTGAGGSIGAGMVAQAPADGYTLLFESFAFVVVPLIRPDLPFDYETAFAPIGQAVALPYVLAVKKDFPAEDLAGFVKAVKAKPGATYGTPGIGTPGHLAGVLLAQRAGIRLEHVPYRGGTEAARDCAAGAIDAVLITANSIKPLIDDGRAKGIALTSAEQRGTLARLPPIASLYPGFDLTSWNGLFAPAATPAPIRARLEAALHHATTDPATVQRLALTGNDAVSASAAEFAERIRRDREMVRQIVRETGMKIE